MNPTIIAWGLLAAFAAGGAGYWWGDRDGHARGALEAQAAHDAAQVQNLGLNLAELRNAISDGAAANRAVRTAMTNLEARNKTSNMELKNAIEKSRQPGAAVCQLDADSLRVLAAAAARADALAAGGLAAGGTGGAVPAGRAPD
ncbi:hypothetical protein [Bordetella ansorpii]|uniref:hypothetical protein n=1 Tax=Bordetella ansorpii TaxID=288768 RepID=UPI000825C1A2|nr:hypothetical protein [Bordetella ansorpii]